MIKRVVALPLLRQRSPFLAPLSTAMSTTGVTESETSSGREYVDASFVLDDKNLLRKSKSSDTGLHVLDLMDRGCLEPDRSLYHILLKECTRLNKPKESKTFHAHFASSKFKDDIVVQNTVLNLYAKCGALEDARVLFDQMPQRDVVSWTALISAYSQHGECEEACGLFPLMLRSGLTPYQFTLSSALKASSGVGSGVDVRGGQLHGFCLKFGYDVDVYVGSAILDMYARCGNMEEARIIFDGLASRNNVTWNALISGHVRRGEGEIALRLFSQMLRENVRPIQFTYSSILSTCAGIGSLEQGKCVHAHVMKSGAKLVAFVGNTLLDMYAKSGCIEDANKVFDRLVKRDVVSWNSMLTAYAQHGLGKVALQRFEEMLRNGVAPNHITFLSVLAACGHAGLLDEGHWCFDLMKKYRVEPQITHYVTMVDLLGRAGHLDRAEKLIKEMPMEPTSAVWGALLGACKMHKNMKLGTYAAERIIELDSHDSGSHMLLLNIYASCGRWNDAAKVRKAMRESGVKKEHACSWVEIGNAVHIFVADDDAHPQREEIYSMWEKISEKINEIGYIPDTSHVLLHVDQQERELKLQYHSEKLALAFALLYTPPKSRIYIKKNIRVCVDCHSAFKFASNVVGREIIVRDTNRFHHFRSGSCSCGDYW